jgi:hypothetical protein
MPSVNVFSSAGQFVATARLPETDPPVLDNPNRVVLELDGKYYIWSDKYDQFYERTLISTSRVTA